MLIQGTISPEMVKVLCVINSSPGLVVTWYHEDNALVEDERTNITILGAGGVFLPMLVITGVTASDNGKYACEAVNSAGLDPVRGTVLLLDNSLTDETVQPQKRSAAKEDSLKSSLLCASDSLNTGVCEIIFADSVNMWE